MLLPVVLAVLASLATEVDEELDDVREICVAAALVTGAAGTSVDG